MVDITILRAQMKRIRALDRLNDIVLRGRSCAETVTARGRFTACCYLTERAFSAAGTISVPLTTFLPD